MNITEFESLPTHAQMHIIAELLEDRIDGIPYVEPPRAPKYDVRLYGKGGYSYASESLVKDLQFYADRARANTNPQYAEKDQKLAASLDRWIAYREVDPMGRVTTMRGEEQVTAQPPSKFPTKHSTDAGVAPF